jgi:hypothetical protein
VRVVTAPQVTAASRNGATAEADKPTLRFFYSPRSGPSRRVEAFLAQVLQRGHNHETFALQRVNCDDHPELAKRSEVTELPTLIVIDRRRVRARLEGSCGRGQIERLLEPWLRRHSDCAADDDGEAPPLGENGSLGAPCTRVGLQLSDGLSFEGWRALGRRIGGVADASTWWLADWAAYGESRYGQKYGRAIAVTGFDDQTLRNYVWVARRFELSRRRDSLSFAHHAEVAALRAEEQDAWLDRAEASGWSRNELRARLRAESPDRKPTRVEHVRLSVDSRRAERWRKAAGASGLELSDWLVTVADDAAAPRPSDARAA